MLAGNTLFWILLGDHPPHLPVPQNGLCSLHRKHCVPFSPSRQLLTCCYFRIEAILRHPELLDFNVRPLYF